QYTNSAQNVAAKLLAVSGSLFTITGKQYVEGTMSVPTTAGGTAIPVSNLANLGWAIFKNNDATNYVELISAVSGTKFAKLAPIASTETNNVSIDIKPSHKGRLHEALGVPEGQSIPVRRLMKAKNSKSVSLRKMVNFAINAKSFKH